MHNTFIRPSGQWPAEFVPGATDAQLADVAQFQGLNGDTGVHGVRINPDSFYGQAVPLPAGYWSTLDTAQAGLVNGDAGNGTWSPAKQIVIGGAGMWCAGPWTFGAPYLMALCTSAFPLTFGDNDYTLLGSGHATASRDLVTACNLGTDISGAVSGGIAVMMSDFASGGGAINFAGSPFRGGGRLLVPLRVHHGATFQYVRFYFNIITGHAGIPAILPFFRAYAVDILGNVAPLNTSTGQVGGGFMSLGTPANVTTYENTAEFLYPTDAGTVVDCTRFTYFAEIVDEGGANALNGNTWLDIVSEMRDIPDMRPS